MKLATVLKMHLRGARGKMVVTLVKIKIEMVTAWTTIMGHIRKRRTDSRGVQKIGSRGLGGMGARGRGQPRMILQHELADDEPDAHSA